MKKSQSFFQKVIVLLAGIVAPLIKWLFIIDNPNE